MVLGYVVVMRAVRQSHTKRDKAKRASALWMTKTNGFVLVLVLVLAPKAPRENVIGCNKRSESRPAPHQV